MHVCLPILCCFRFSTNIFVKVKTSEYMSNKKHDVMVMQANDLLKSLYILVLVVMQVWCFIILLGLTPYKFSCKPDAVKP